MRAHNEPPIGEFCQGLDDQSFLPAARMPRFPVDSPQRGGCTGEQSLSSGDTGRSVRLIRETQHVMQMLPYGTCMGGHSIRILRRQRPLGQREQDLQDIAHRCSIRGKHGSVNSSIDEFGDLFPVTDFGSSG
ncbi:hypothetical protein BEK98_03925 [Streptomyces diastatochromogenes]|uniref:Uncharacterized protein n=1 Tax=Streptomyces diastatochromogenes TaxID=42236 RepID=A0A233SU32_STRDA|nr:hypothetical protein BEK98_03925 [Streptomyces diastatochromogenes]